MRSDCIGRQARMIERGQQVQSNCDRADETKCVIPPLQSTKKFIYQFIKVRILAARRSASARQRNAAPCISAKNTRWLDEALALLIFYLNCISVHLILTVTLSSSFMGSSQTRIYSMKTAQHTVLKLKLLTPKPVAGRSTKKNVYCSKRNAAEQAGGDSQDYQLVILLQQLQNHGGKACDNRA